MGVVAAAGPLAWGHPHEPEPQAAPKEGTVQDAAGAAALPPGSETVIVDGAHHPGAAVEILKALASRPKLRELRIYGATEWPEGALAPLRDFQHLEVLRIFDDSTRRKPGFLDHIAKVSTLRILQLYYSGD